MIILGIDPGSLVTGYGIIEKKSSLRFIDCGVIRTTRKKEFPQRLKEIYDQVKELITTHKPDVVVFEDVFYGRDFQAALKLGHARGVAMIAAQTIDAELTAYAPKAVKQALTGNGNSSKEQVKRMVESILELKEPISPLDASDALAMAICHAFRIKTV